MKKINLKGISEILSEKEMKNVMGGSGDCKQVTCTKTCGNGQSYEIYCYGSCVESDGGKRVDCVPCGDGPGDGGGYIQCGS